MEIFPPCRQLYSSTKGTEGYDKIYRIRNYLTMLGENIRREYQLSREISIDETMIPHKGRLSYKQYIKNKPTKWLIKLWVLSEATTGYVYRFQVYLGKVEGNPEQHLAKRVVRDLTITEANKNHHLYMDNFYCDPHLFKELLDKKIFCCGTVKFNRKGFPQEVVITKERQKQMRRGDYLWRCDGQLVASGWLDKRPVYHLSTSHPPTTNEPTTVARREGRGERQSLQCPTGLSEVYGWGGSDRPNDKEFLSFAEVKKGLEKAFQLRT
ncbi:piggyBac transposable element-derived protein 4-like [Actinia tenebrosa]|uniref:PiggyBac transposable element-derived protein 4-like n=1 Tax=Actinia tenebrosa TaxID=6105 RepID=A0A6P8HPX4_ACTTE|nr:piggyBac transposable element-derived protein 4-like [Actinia tenebrosa]XP_031554725.1 piggyBac transposable element-derived protein 4-like [Actinia tenebrosa]